jgi:hypothetical protein
MRDFVEAGFDVALDHPVEPTLTGREELHLGHRVVSPASGAEPVGTRVEVRLENRLQHQLQRRLDHPVGDRGDPQPTQLAAGFRDHPLTHRQGPETTVLHRAAKLGEEPLDPDPDQNGYGRVAVHPGGLGALVTPHPIPGHQKEGRVGDEIEQITELLVRIVGCPTVQLGLDLLYPALRGEQS